MLRASRFAVTFGLPTALLVAVACAIGSGCAVSRETSSSSGTVHAPTFVDPRSEESHGRLLRSKRWRPMLEPSSPESCGRCHDGAPTRPDGVTSSAPGAPACTTCHREPEGAQGCNTCHGQGAGEPETLGAHAAHVGLACATCHPVPGNPIIGGEHGNGTLEMRMEATFDRSTKACVTACHARAGGARPKPTWTEKTPMGCGDCHGSPPPGHFAGACTSCHREANATGTAFLSTPLLHVNGRVDLGDGSGKCGSCHGHGDDPWPSSNAHPAHQKPSAAMAAPCTSCHVVPSTFGPGTLHPRGAPPAVVLSGLAVARGTTATYSAGSCREVYCHGAGLEGTVPAMPAWSDTSGKSRACGACHGTPPGAPHVGSPACELCHRDADVLGALHVNGAVDR